MKVINDIQSELVAISKDLNAGIIDKAEANLKLDLVIQSIESVELNLNYNPIKEIDTRIHQTFNQLLFRTKYRSVSAIQTLKTTTNRRSYNAKARHLLKQGLFFSHFHKTIKNNCEAWIRRNRLEYYNLHADVFTTKGGNDNDSK
jgi:hypothetical protein